LKRQASSLCTIAMLAPLALASGVMVAVAMGERAGATPFAGLTPRNSAEAAGLGSASDVVRFLRLGEDPHRVYAIRPQVISSAVLQATTLEAAMWSRQLELVELLEREGAFREWDERRALACLAADLKIDDIVEHLAPGGTAYCEAGKAVEHVLARTKATGTN
jgi:hypothetical protein